MANALHFGSDFAGTLAVLVGLVAAAYGFPEGDAIAALFVAGLVVAAALRLLARNVGVLMDRAETGAEDEARRAIAALDPPVELRRLRVRRSGGAHFADVDIGIPPGAAVGQGHTAADRVEEALRVALPDVDVVVHVEPGDAGAATRERALAAALAVPRVRELHNLTVLDVDGRVEVALHLKLPGELSLEEAHAVAEEVEEAILASLPEVGQVSTHLEPLAEAAVAEAVRADEHAVERVVREATGSAPRELRLVRTDEGIVVLLTLALPGDESLAGAHGRASEVEERVRAEVPGVADVVVHTEPG